LIIIDADGLNVVCRHVDCVRGHGQAILTPNVVEFGRLWKCVTGEEQPTLTDWSEQPALTVANLSSDDPSSLAVSRLARELGCTIFLKVTLTQGPVDVISNGSRTIAVGTPGSGKRCGGIGDILAGTISTTVHLAVANRVPDPLMEACVAGSLIVRRAASLAFEEKQWSLTAPDVLDALSAALRVLLIEANTQSSL